ncbi:MAG: hypothetical protein HC897_10955 [Thermoanaerobaculia bacterium]|nr:hypothetical protein [Thermoanaerobaculia bacterium]
MAGWESLKAVLEVVELFEELEIPYHVGGSLASSVHGLPRQTNDLDLVADLPMAVAPILVLRLQERFYIDAESIRRAIQRRSSFNLVHLATGFKVDVFVAGRGRFDRMELARHGAHHLEGLEREVVVKSAEDTVLRKLEWFRLGGEVSDRQWNDILGIVRTQGDRLDREYLREWAGNLGIDDLLERALGFT